MSGQDPGFSTTAPTFSELIKLAICEAKGSIHTCLPATVLSYDADRQTATVQPSIKYPFADPDTGKWVFIKLPPIPNRPVYWASTSAGSLTMDLLKGDDVMLLFIERGSEEWKHTSNNNATPSDPRRFDLADAVVLPGLHPRGRALPADAHASGAVVLRGDDIRAGSANASDFVALQSLTEAQLAAIKNAIAGAAVVAGDGGAALKANILAALGPAFPGNVGATKVKAE